MDSLTQATLGAAVGEVTLGRQVGNRALLWGALCGTLPDLDVFIPLGDVVRDFTYHRSVSHSLLVTAALTPLVVWIILRVHPRTRPYRWRWALLVYLAFVTHALLDSFTVYGTQILWPLSNTPVLWSTIFIIDPLYTLPLLAGVTAALVLTRDSSRGHQLNAAGLILSTLYLGWTVGVKTHVAQLAEESLNRQGIPTQRILTTPTPFNSILWRVLAMDANGYYEGFYSLLDAGSEVQMRRYPSENVLLTGIEEHWPVQRLQWFTGGFYAVRSAGSDVVITDLRMGLQPDFVFSFKVGELGAPHTRPTDPALIPSTTSFARIPTVMRRIRDPHATP